MEKITTWGYRCKRCGHTWVPRNLGEGSEDVAPDLPLPKVCPRCKSPYWNLPRQKEREGIMNDLSAWRMQADSVLAERFALMESENRLSPVERGHLEAMLQTLRTTPNDATTMNLLRRFAPDDATRSKYPA
jgi:hypothetical protein